ncbi:hypothetical protein [Kitasatospora phosalacinea]|uniref:hypothetical protein n=1 Tax=Kitasatospora phosalacinea TaxID=2065 RepID=UPI000AE92C4F|nr:hypothetical protein [Kitasatospora phosalacinea]
MSVQAPANGVAAALSGVALVAVLAGCSGSSPAPKAAPAPTPSASAAPTASAASAASAVPTGDRTQELERLRAAVAAPARPFSASLSLESQDDQSYLRGNGTVNVSDVQTSSMGLDVLTTGESALQINTTTTRDAVYTQVEGAAWEKHGRRPGTVLVADHRPMVQALLERGPDAYRGLEKLPGMNGGLAYHLVGELPVAQVADGLGSTLRQRIAEHRIEQCDTDLLVDSAGRLSRLELTCAGDGYRAASSLSLAEYGPSYDIPVPSDL